MTTLYDEALGLFKSGDYDAAATKFREAYDDAQRDGDASMACHALRFRAVCMHGLGRVSDAYKIIENARAHAARLSDAVVLAYVLNTKALFLTTSGRLHDALAALDEALLARDENSTDSIYPAMETNRSSVRSDLGQLNIAYQERQDQLQKMRQQPPTARLLRCLTNAALDCIHLGDFRQALAHLAEFDEMHETSAIGDSHHHALMHRAKIARYQDLLDESEALIDQAMKIAPPSVRHELRIERLRVRQQAELYLGLLDDWRDVYDEVSDAGFAGTMLAASAGYATALWALEEPAEALDMLTAALSEPSAQEYLIQRAEPLSLKARIEVEANPSESLATLELLAAVPVESWVYRAYVIPAVVSVHTIVGDKEIAHSALLGLESKVDEHDNMGDQMAHRRIHQLRQLII